jgi:hypothetical protein
MKKSLLLFISFSLIALFSVAQQVPRDKVVVEIGTGTWCQYCPGAAMGADDLIANGYEVAIIEYHNGDDYTNTYSNARNSYYGVPGFPTAYFDGGNSVVGGSNTESMFPYYYPKVNARMAVMSSFTIALTGTHACFSEFTAHITVEKVATNTSTNLKLHTVLTESEIIESWQGQSKLDFVERLMAPNQNGTAVSFAGGNTQEYDITFNVDPTWVMENCEVVVFLQDATTKEIFQGTKIPLMDFTPEFQYDANVKNVIDIPVTSCTGTFSPEVDLRNLGNETMTSVDIFYQVNGGEMQSYAWSGTLHYLAEAQVALPPIAFEGAENNELVVYTSNPNGNPDECPDNDSWTISVPEAMHTLNTVKLIMRTDNYPEETTWDLKNSAGEVLFSGGPYTTGGQMIQQTFNLTDEDCYTYTIYDSGGDGLDTPGFFMLYQGSNTTIFQGGIFGYSSIVDFNTTDVVGIGESQAESTIDVYPNPMSDKARIDLSLQSGADVKVSVYNLAGQEIYSAEPGTLNAGSHSFTLDGSSWNQGIYIYKVMAGDKLFTGKLTVK